MSDKVKQRKSTAVVLGKVLRSVESGELDTVRYLGCPWAGYGQMASLLRLLGRLSDTTGSLLWRPDPPKKRGSR